MAGYDLDHLLQRGELSEPFTMAISAWKACFCPSFALGGAKRFRTNVGIA